MVGVRRSWIESLPRSSAEAEAKMDEVDKRKAQERADAGEVVTADEAWDRVSKTLGVVEIV